MNQSIVTGIVGLIVGLLIGFFFSCGSVDEVDRLAQQAEHDEEKKEIIAALDEQLTSARDSLAFHKADAATWRYRHDTKEPEVRVIRERIESPPDLAPLSPDSLSRLATSLCAGTVVPLGLGYDVDRPCLEDFVEDARAAPHWRELTDTLEELLELKRNENSALINALDSAGDALTTADEVIRLQRERADAWEQAAYDVAREPRLTAAVYGLAGTTVDVGGEVALRVGPVEVLGRGGYTPEGGYGLGGVRVGLVSW